MCICICHVEPDPPSTVKAETVNSTAVRLSWIPVNISDFGIWYDIRCFNDNNTDCAYFYAVYTRENEAYAVDLEPCTNYNFQILATNGECTSIPSDTVSANTTGKYFLHRFFTRYGYLLFTLKRLKKYFCFESGTFT